MNLSIGYCTSRHNPELAWFLDSLSKQMRPDDHIFVGVVEPDTRISGTVCKDSNLIVRHIQMKPSVWAGPSRITKDEWWSKAASLNTFLCLANTKWIATVDDRCVLMPGWLDHIRVAMEAKTTYVLAGRYEKRHSMTVENGVIKHGGIITGVDGRYEHCAKHYAPYGMKPPYKSPAGWTFGCALAMPLEWALEVNGWDESCDGMGAEDTTIGLMLSNNGHPIFYEPRMLMVEDRTPGECGPVMRKEDYGQSPNDFSHKMLNLLKDRKTAMHGFDIRKVREDALSGKPWPAPWGPTHHLWDGKPLGELL